MTVNRIHSEILTLTNLIQTRSRHNGFFTHDWPTIVVTGFCLLPNSYLSFNVNLYRIQIHSNYVTCNNLPNTPIFHITGIRMLKHHYFISGHVLCWYLKVVPVAHVRTSSTDAYVHLECQLYTSLHSFFPSSLAVYAYVDIKWDSDTLFANVTFSKNLNTTCLKQFDTEMHSQYPKSCILKIEQFIVLTHMNKCRNILIRNIEVFYMKYVYFDINWLFPNITHLVLMTWP